MFVDDSLILADVAAVLKVASASALPAWWVQVVNLAHQTAYNKIVSRLAARGYSPTQIAAWDQGAAVERTLALYESLVQAGGVETIPGGLAKRYEEYTAKDGELDTAAITAAGLFQTPQGPQDLAAAGAICFEPATFPILPPGGRGWDAEGRLGW
jgi:hypothetical protein